MTRDPAIGRGNGWLRGPQGNLELSIRDGSKHYTLDGRELQNGAEIELRLRGNSGWISAKVEGLPNDIVVVFAAEDGKPIRTTLSPGIELRWAK